MNRIDPDQLIKGDWYTVNGSTVRFLGEMFNGPNPRQWRKRQALEFQINQLEQSK